MMLKEFQTFDLTDLDWSPELWVVYHDDDDQNSRLAQHIWEENGMDVPEEYIKDLLPLLGMCFEYVLSSIF